MAERLPLAGFSVTIPHKQKVIRYLDAIDPLAKRIGAVNTVWRKAGRWRGANTDVAGVTTPLARVLRLQKSTVLIVGNGGAARGAAFALSDAGARVTLTGRNPDRVRALAKICGAEALAKEQLEGRHFDAVVHATPSACSRTWTSVSSTVRFRRTSCSTWSYNPLETALLRRAREQGKTAIPGLDMFIEQARGPVEIWTGETAPRSVMHKAAMEALSHEASGTPAK